MIESPISPSNQKRIFVVASFELSEQRSSIRNLSGHGSYLAYPIEGNSAPGKKVVSAVMGY